MSAPHPGEMVLLPASATTRRRPHLLCNKAFLGPIASSLQLASSNMAAAKCFIPKPLK